MLSQKQIVVSSEIRKAFPVLSEVTYLNVGTYGLMPEPAYTEFREMQAEFELKGVASGGVVHKKTEETRLRIAKLISAESDEIAFTRNATDGINLTLAGINWQPGDEVITTSEEHEAMIHPLLYLQNHKGIRVHLVDVDADPQMILHRMEKVYNDKTRLVAMSLVTCETGTRLPGKEISSWASNHNVLSLLDGAQASGAFPVNVREIGCDFYASNGHKWLSGPKGTGFFYGKKDKLNGLYLALVGAGSLEKVEIASGTANPWPNANRFEYGTRAWALTAGLCSSLDWFEKIGWDSVYTHIADLAGYLKDQIISDRDLELITPVEPEHSSGLTSFIIKDAIAGEISTKIREKFKIYVRVIPHYNAIRISTAHFNSAEDIDRLITSIHEIMHSKS
jgi:selenocysteine lyase/cysteine desulfurase